MVKRQIDGEPKQIEEAEMNSSCAHFPSNKRPDPKGKCARPDGSSNAENAKVPHTYVEFSNDVSLSKYPTRYDVRGLLPVEARDTNGKLVRDEHGSVVLLPKFRMTRIRGAQWFDELMLSVIQLLPTINHVRVLAAVHAITNPLKINDIKIHAHWCDSTGEVVANDGSTDGTCRYSVPTICVRIPDLSFKNVSRFLHPDRKSVLEQLQDDAARNGMTFDKDQAHDLLRDHAIVEDEFWQIIDNLVRLGLLVVLDEDGERVGVLNHISMAQCSPTIRLTMLPGAPDSVMQPTIARDKTTTPGGVRKPASKQRSQGNRALRARISKLSETNKRKDRAMVIMEHHHAEDRAKDAARIAELQAETSNLRAELIDIQGQMQRLVDHIGDVLANPHNSDADVRHALEEVFTTTDHDDGAAHNRAHSPTHKEAVR